VWTEVAKVGDVAVGGLKFVKLAGAQATLANCDGTLYAVGRRCGHMNAPLDQGSLSGHVLTCPLHFAQYDVRDGTVLAYPLDRHFGAEPLPAPARHVLGVEQRLQRKIRVEGLATWPVRVTGESIEVDV
jgi:nitrite reductase/ring-hydroxylating ferredoxin subunit